MYTSIVTICEFVVIFMYLTRNCIVYVNKKYILKHLDYLHVQTDNPWYYIHNKKVSKYDQEIPQSHTESCDRSWT